MISGSFFRSAGNELVLTISMQAEFHLHALSVFIYVRMLSLLLEMVLALYWFRKRLNQHAVLFLSLANVLLLFLHSNRAASAA